MKKQVFLLLLIPLLSSCEKYYLSICQERIDQDSLASTAVVTPDPRQKNPPLGQRLIVEWQIPKEILEKNPTLHLSILYKNLSEESFVYPISHKRGYKVYELQGVDYKKKKGILSYKAQIQTQDGSVFREWTHQMWVQVIQIEEEASVPTPAPVEPWEQKDLEEQELEWNEIPTQEMQSADESLSDTKSTSSSVEAQSIQGSVSETQGSIQEESVD